MAPIIQEHLDELRALCRQYNVQSLYLFGSAANGEFKPEESDIDFLVSFETMDPYTYLDAYMGLADSLEQLLGRPVDLVIERAIKNPYFREEVEETRVKLYAA